MKQSRKRYKWWCHCRGQVYANDFRFTEPVSEREARAYIRSWFSVGGKRVTRLPAGTQVWPGEH
jgi:hypothetical protein